MASPACGLRAGWDGQREQARINLDLCQGVAPPFWGVDTWHRGRYSIPALACADATRSIRRKEAAWLATPSSRSFRYRRVSYLSRSMPCSWIIWMRRGSPVLDLLHNPIHIRLHRSQILWRQLHRVVQKTLYFWYYVSQQTKPRCARLRGVAVQRNPAGQDQFLQVDREGGRDLVEGPDRWHRSRRGQNVTERRRFDVGEFRKVAVAPPTFFDLGPQVVPES